MGQRVLFSYLLCFAQVHTEHYLTSEYKLFLQQQGDPFQPPDYTSHISFWLQLSL